jgi:hypothetical protein
LAAMERTITFYSGDPRRMSMMYDRGVDTDGDDELDGSCTEPPSRKRRKSK